MALPDLSRLSSLSLEHVGALNARLRGLGVDRSAMAPYARHGEGLSDRMRRPLRAFHLRRTESPLVFALRLFVFMDPVTRAQASAALGDELLLEALLEAGLLVERDSLVVCPLYLNLVDDVYVLCDDLTLGGAAVMGSGVTTAELIQAAWPLQHVERVLDLGCGAGTAALLLAKRATLAVGTDLNPRAILLSRFNLSLAGLDNVEFALGDLFAPVADTRFDLIVAQPPFVSKPDSAEDVTYLHGGARGDELVLRMLRELPPQLAPRGRAVFLVDWPRYDTVTPAERIREALGGGAFDVLVLSSLSKNLEEYVAFYAAGAHPELTEAYAAAVHEHLEHLRRIGLTELRATLIVIRATAHKPWQHTVNMRSFSEARPTGAQVERLIRAQDLLNADPARLLAARLIVPEGTRFTQEASGGVRIEMPASRLLGPVVCAPSAAELLSAINESATVEAAVSALATKLDLNTVVGREQILEGARNALDQGLLEVVLDG